MTEVKLLSLDNLALYHPKAQEMLDIAIDQGWALYYSVWGREAINSLRWVGSLDSRMGDAGCSLITFQMDALPGSSMSHHVKHDDPRFTWAKEGLHPTKYYLHPDARD